MMSAGDGEPAAAAAPPNATDAGDGASAAAAAAVDAGDPTGPQPLQQLLPYSIVDDGSKQPLPDAYSLFLRSGTAAVMGLTVLQGIAGLAAAEAVPAGEEGPAARPLFVSVPRDRVLADIQLQGAISDWHPIREAVRASDMEALVVRSNEDDAYGDGGNFEVACTQAAADAWVAAEEQRRAAEATAAAQAAPAPEAKQRRAPRPWVDQGTEAELAAEAGPGPRAPIRLILERTLRDLRRGTTSTTAAPDAPDAADAAAAAALPQGAAAAAIPPATPSSAAAGGGGRAASEPQQGPPRLSDVDASDLWSSASNECRPFKDPNYDLRRPRRDARVQAVPSIVECGVQATGARAVPDSSQYEPLDIGAAEKARLARSPALDAFVERVRDRCEEALLQNAAVDVVADELAALAEDEEAAAAAADSAAAAAQQQPSAAGPAGGGPSTAAPGGVVELQSATDLEYSRGRVVSWAQWVPGRRGVVAVAVTDPASHQERLARAGRLSDAHVLIWNFRDPIRPEAVLECPYEVFSFQINPASPNVIAGGCYNGQVALWDLSEARDRGTSGGSSGSTLRGTALGSSAGEAGGATMGVTAGDASSSGGGAEPPVIRCRSMSALEASHTAPITDLQWLPGVEIDRAGRATAVPPGSAGAGGGGLARTGTLGVPGGMASPGPLVPRDCCFFATIAADGAVMFWDARADRLQRRGARGGGRDEAEAAWRPVHVMHLLNMQGVDFAGSRLCFDFRDLSAGAFLAGSLDGQILGGCFVRPPGSTDTPDYTQFIRAAHAGPLVALSRSPFVDGLLLSVGDWGFRLWLGDAEAPLFCSPAAQEAYTSACWSPSRPGLIFLGDAAGTLHAWDLLERTHEPALRVGVASAPLSSIAVAAAATAHATASSHGAGGAAAAATAGGAQHQLLAVGDGVGALHLLQLPRSLRRPLPGEVRLMGEFVRREGARIAEVASRQPVRAAALKVSEAAAKAAEEAAARLSSSSPLPAAGGGGGAAAARRRSSFGGAAATTGGGATIPGGPRPPAGGSGGSVAAAGSGGAPRGSPSPPRGWGGGGSGVGASGGGGPLSVAELATAGPRAGWDGGKEEEAYRRFEDEFLAGLSGLAAA